MKRRSSSSDSYFQWSKKQRLIRDAIEPSRPNEDQTSETEAGSIAHEYQNQHITEDTSASNRMLEAAEIREISASSEGTMDGPTGTAVQTDGVESVQCPSCSRSDDITSTVNQLIADKNRMRRNIKSLKLQKNLACSIIQRMRIEMERLVDETFKCSICQETLVRPILLRCTHWFCIGCLRTQLAYSDLCPLCRKEISEPRLMYWLCYFLDEWASFQKRIKEDEESTSNETDLESDSDDEEA